MASTMPSAGFNECPVEDEYKQLGPVEHILCRPDCFIGSVNAVEVEQAFVWDNTTKCMSVRSVTVVPGLSKILDEVLVNAADNLHREGGVMTYIRVCINAADGTISVRNDGRGMRVEMHPEANMYVPQLVFGELRTSSNYDDDAKKVTGGRNGFGAKLTNAFSLEFKVETYDAKRGIEYSQTWLNNMSECHPPSVKQVTETQRKRLHAFTQVTFKPDLARFGLTELTPDVVETMQKRVVDLAGTLRGRVKVYLNDERVPVKTFQQYAKLLFPSTMKYFDLGPRWEIAVGPSPTKAFQQVSFVNGIATTNGGSHVDYIRRQVEHVLVTHLRKDVSRAVVRRNMALMVNCLIDNPSFDSQSKEKLNTKVSEFGSKVSIADHPKLVATLCRSKLAKQCISAMKVETSAAVVVAMNTGISKRRKLILPKLDDANWAGGPKSKQCSLILTEGDSAKTLAVSGLSVVGRDQFGVFPLKGKLLNVRSASVKSVADNEEVHNIMKILGLHRGREYSSVDGLRYGRVVIMADQDHDGSHIKGLVVNLFQHFWPSLMEATRGAFVTQFVTPIYRAFPRTRRQQGRPRAEVVNLYTEPQFDAWRTSAGIDVRDWNVKYLKGLGSSSTKDAREYFANMERCNIPFLYDGGADKEAMDMVFSKSRANDRKAWLLGLPDIVRPSYPPTGVSLSQFVHTDLALFGREAVRRAVPQLMDGFKPSQRKVLFACTELHLVQGKKEMKVSELAGMVSSMTDYHHGPKSMEDVIVTMTQTFVGANNVNLLVPIGQLGSRLMGGKDAANARYVSTTLHPLASLVFLAADAPLLTHNTSAHGKVIEPHHFLPIIPWVLVNGCMGMGVGFQSTIPQFDPLALTDAVMALLDDKPLPELMPWFRGFTGSVLAAPNKVTTSGTYSLDGDGSRWMNITELPVGVWTETYKNKVLVPLMSAVTSGPRKRDAIVDTFNELHTVTTVNFRVKLTEAGIVLAGTPTAFEKLMKVRASISKTSMYLFTSGMTPRKFRHTEDILRAFFEARRPFFAKRKQHELELLTAKRERCRNQHRFVAECRDGKLRIQDMRSDELMQSLHAAGYRQFQPDAHPGLMDSDAPLHRRGYDYLVHIPMVKMTVDNMLALQAKEAALAEEVEVLSARHPDELWRMDLGQLRTALVDHRAADLQERKQEQDVAFMASTQAKGKSSRGRRRSATRRRAPKKPRKEH